MLDFALSPLTWLLVGGLAARWLHRCAWLRRAAVALVALAVLSMTPLGANALLRLVESRAPDATAECAANPPAAIVVLGAGLEREPRDGGDVASLSATGLRRLHAGLAQFNAQTGAHLYLLGASSWAVPESTLSARLAERLGVAPDAITTEADSTTTWENARHLRSLSPTPPPRIRLVTSRLHLARAALAFRAAGFEVCPLDAGSDYLPPGDLGYFLPRTSALRKADAAIHELVGDAVYRLRAN